jgi:hypothetical protein
LPAAFAHLRAFMSAMLCGALASGCAHQGLKRPRAVQPSALPIKGHTANATQRDQHLQIGSYQLADLAGTPILPSGMRSYGRMQEQNEWKYSFSLKGQGKLLQAECVEKVGDVRFFGLGQVTLDLDCRCAQAGAQVAQLTLAHQKGSVELAQSQRFTLEASRESQQGKSSSDVLGYQLSGAQGDGAVDVTKQPHAYLPKDLAEANRAPLVCMYAALLLHRPRK